MLNDVTFFASHSLATALGGEEYDTPMMFCLVSRYTVKSSLNPDFCNSH